MTRIYSAFALQEEVNPGFDITERELWAAIVQELERFSHEAD
jgi:hypothetical protein